MRRGKKLQKLADKLQKTHKISDSEFHLMYECSAELNNLDHDSKDPIQDEIDNWIIDTVNDAFEEVLLYPLPDIIDLWDGDFRKAEDYGYYALYKPLPSMPNEIVIAPPVYIGINRWVFENEYRKDKKMTIIGKYQKNKKIKLYKRRYYKDIQELYDDVKW